MLLKLQSSSHLLPILLLGTQQAHSGTADCDPFERVYVDLSSMCDESLSEMLELFESL
ncbi:MAG: hypothetical protein ACK4N1_06775 [Pseudorhizobium sp.]